MTITDKLTIIKNSVNDIKTVLSNKGVAYGDITTLATAIENIKVNNSDLPSGYTEIAYLEKKILGSEYFDLNYRANKNTRLVLDFEITSWATNSLEGLIGYDSGDTSTSFYICLWKWAATPGSNNKVSSATALSIEDGETLLVYKPIELNKKYTYTLDGDKYMIDDTLEIDIVTNNDITTAGNLYLFRVNSTSSNFNSAKSCSMGKVYGLKIYESDELVRDFVPVQRKDSLEYGLYDKINGFYLSPSSATAFTGGV